MRRIDLHVLYTLRLDRLKSFFGFLFQFIIPFVACSLE